MTSSRIQELWRLDPVWGHAPWRAAQSRPERVMHVHLNTPAEPQRSLCQALQSLTVGANYCRIDWTGLAARDLPSAVVSASATLRPTLVFMQLQRGGVLTQNTVTEIRRVSGSPELVIACWCGDVGGTNGPYRQPGDNWAYELSKVCDLMLYTSMSQVRAHRSRGMDNAAYLQIGYDEDRYFEGGDDEFGDRFDAVFLGVNYDERHWSSLPKNDAALRRKAAEALRLHLGKRFGLFGRAWATGDGDLHPAHSGDVYRHSRLALSVSISSFLERYSSDRLFRALACGTPVMMKRFDDWGSHGLAHGENVLVWETIDELLALTSEWLDPARREPLRQIGRKGARLAREHCSWGIRMQEFTPLIAAVRSVSVDLSRPW